MDSALKLIFSCFIDNKVHNHRQLWKEALALHPWENNINLLFNILINIFYFLFFPCKYLSKLILFNYNIIYNKY